MTNASLERELRAIVRATPWLLEVLAQVRRVGPRHAYVAAGAVRDTVWDALSGRTAAPPAADVDVVYWSAREPPECALDYQAELTRTSPTFSWEVTNQAWVHLWYASEHGAQVAPLNTLAQGLATWPETATAVGVRLADHDEIEVIAPLGLDDLFARVVRHNPARASAALYAERVAKKGWARRWPELRILPGQERAP